MQKDHTKFILDLIKEHPGRYTRREVRTIATQAFKRPITVNTVKHITDNYDVADLFKPDIARNQYTRPTQATPKQKPVFKMDIKKRRPDRILVIGDLHEPFCLPEYLDFCLATYKRFECTHTIFIGDLVDNHFTSYHETDPDGMSALDELAAATNRITRWVDAFPQADVCIGNHDRLVTRKAFSSGISAIWLRNYNEVLNAPGWDFQEEFIYNKVRYIHGEQGTARNRSRKDLISTVQGHRHNEAYTEYTVGQTFRIFGTQVGCGVDRKAYAMAYAKAGPKPVIGCAVILDNGTLPINVLLNL